MDKDRLFLLNRLMSMYGNMIKKMCNLFLQDQPTLGDCAARTVFVCVWNELSGIPDVSHEKTWLRCIANIKTIQAIAGHSDIQTTMNLYVHKEAALLRQAGIDFNRKITNLLTNEKTPKPL